MKKNILTRRQFLKESTTAALVGTLYLNVPKKLKAENNKKTRVVLIRNRDVMKWTKDGKVQLNRPRQEVVKEMLDEAVKVLLNEKDAASAWKKLIHPDDIVGIKTNVWRQLPTTREVEIAIKQGVLTAGVPENNISIGDRGILYDPIFQKATALINARPMRTHHWAGVGSLLKNYIMFIENPSSYHPDTCADLAKIWKLPLVKGKTRLNILVMFTPLFHGIGPHHFNPKYVWPYCGLRREFFKENRPINPPPKHIILADTRYGLGTADPDNIELVKLGWQEGALI